MKRSVIVRLSILISLVLLVKCDDAGTFNVDDEGDSSNAEINSGGVDEEAINTKVGGGTEISPEDETNLKCIGSVRDFHFINLSTLMKL